MLMALSFVCIDEICLLSQCYRVRTMLCSSAMRRMFRIA